MGWKTLKKKFSIDGTISIEGDELHVGSGLITSLVVVNLKTGYVRESAVFAGSNGDRFKTLLTASKEDILSSLEAKDVFEKSIPIYRYENDVIIEELCENPSYPHNTHSGLLIYENTFSTDKEKIIERAKRELDAGISMASKTLVKAQREIKELQAYIDEMTQQRESLDKQSTSKTPV